MGGFGSTRWGWTPTRATTDGLVALDVRAMARAGALRPGARSEWTWSRRGEATDRITAIAETGGVVLDYVIMHRDGRPEPVRERVVLERTACPFGGARPWFACPGCGSRRAVLHCRGGRFRCRACHDLAYASTREAPWERARRRAGKLRDRLGDDAPRLPGLVGLWPDKPRGMRWRTYARLVGELDAAEGATEAGLAARHAALMARFDRKYGPP